MALKVLMLGWEYPPLKSGGLGTACYGLTKALTRLGAQITFVLPRTIKSELSNHLNLKMTDQYQLSEQEIKFLEVDSLLSPYLDEASYERIWKRTQEELARVEGGETFKSLYGKDLIAEVSRFALVAAKVAKEVEFDLIVCHDWMTFDAALAIKHQSGKKMVAHIHAVERDRTGDHPNQLIFDIEKRGLNEADFVIANSYITQKNVHEQYGVPHSKMQAVHLAIDQEDVKIEEPVEKPIAEKIVSFVGRMTLQKGPEYFIDTV
jgi:glycosyltransferase involved in cell wall biosynthesis